MSSSNHDNNNHDDDDNNNTIRDNLFNVFFLGINVSPESGYALVVKF